MKVGGTCGISLFFRVSYDIGSNGARNCFAESGVGNLEKSAVQNFGSDPFAFGWFLRGGSSLLFGNHLERWILFLLMG